MAKKQKKEPIYRRDFAEILAEKIKKFGEVDEGELGDNSGRWVSVQMGDYHLSFSFNMKGNTITDIGLYKDVWEIADQKQLFTTRKK